MVGRNERTASELLVVARIVRIDKTPQMALFPDPWQMHTNNLMRLKPERGYIAHFQDGALAIAIPAPDRSDSHSGSIYHETMNPSTHIRLIELKDGKFNDSLKGKIRIVPITKPGRFWALSYVWGPPSERVLYYFETTHGTLPITASLNLALRKIRARNQSVRIWADAVCINQESSFEKALQLQLMGDIYHSSERVFAWIGAEEEKSDHLMATLTRFSSPEFDQSNETSVKGIVDSINDLVTRPWFKRVWIVQELIRGSNVFIVCGNRELQWEEFFHAVVVYRELWTPTSEWERRKFEIGIGPTYALGRTRELLINQRRKFTLLQLLEFFSYTEATKEEDKLFALRGLAYDVSGEAFDPLYGDDIEIPVRKYAEAFVREGHALDLLYRAGWTSKCYPFSSWIPRWTRGTFPRTISEWQCYGNEPFYAGPRMPAEVKLDAHHPKILEVRGYEVDRIASLSTIEVSSSSLFDVRINFTKAMFEYRKAIKSLGGQYPTGETPDELQFRIPIGSAKRPQKWVGETGMKGLDLSVDREQVEEQDWLPTLASELLAIHEGQEQSQYENLPTDIKLQVLAYWETAAVFASRIPKGKFCVTENGYAGLVPENSSIGDRICVFHGGRVPFVLSTALSSTTSCKLVGECYIHGIMHGAALRGDAGREAKTFRLL
jgi:hypothetical protein